MAEPPSSSSPFFFLLGEGDAQATASLPQCYLSLLCWQPAAVGTNSNTVQCKIKAPRIRQAILAGGAVKGQLIEMYSDTLVSEELDLVVRWTKIKCIKDYIVGAVAANDKEKHEISLL